MDFADIITFIKPEALVLVPFLLILGKMVKTTPKVQDWMIPWILGTVGMVCAVLIVCLPMGRFTPEGILQGIIQGMLAAGTSVYIHQLKIQTKKGIEGDSKYRLPK